MNSPDSLKKYPQHAKLESLSRQKGIGGLAMEYGSIVCTGGQQLITEFNSALNEISRLRGALEKIIQDAKSGESKEFQFIYATAQQALSANQGEKDE